MEYTYAGILSAIQNKLSALNNWKKILYGSAYQRILEAITYITDKFVY